MTDPILQTQPLGNPPWPTVDPFLFCVHHKDDYPEGNEHMGPQASLAGRHIGQDFANKDGWNMYHGNVVPGFPSHPHRGFETITLARRGYIDHSDSLGATARFGRGDVQWMTAGSGIVHSEMFPLVEREQPNPCELFQIWINLPSQDKLVSPYFTMLWAPEIPNLEFADDAGRRTEVTVVAGALDTQRPPAPPPNSWASRPEADVGVMSIRLDARAHWTLPAAAAETTLRTLYFFAGQGLRVADRSFDRGVAITLRGDVPVPLEAGDENVECLLLQGRPIGEPVAHYGPFVMNTREELQQTMVDYSRTRFGRWPWDRDDPVHARDRRRFAQHADGRIEEGPE